MPSVICWGCGRSRPRRIRQHDERTRSIAGGGEGTHPANRRRLGHPDPAQEAGRGRLCRIARSWRSEEHTSELQSLMRISYAVFCLKKKTLITNTSHNTLVSIDNPI